MAATLTREWFETTTQHERATMKKIPGYDRHILTDQDEQEFFEEAERRGEVYRLFVEGQDNPGHIKDGIVFQADTLEEAKGKAYCMAWRESKRLDGTDDFDNDACCSALKEQFGSTRVNGLELWNFMKSNSFKKEVETPPLPYPTRTYKLLHQGKLIMSYVPPNPDDVASGKVVMPSVDDVRDRNAAIPADSEIY